MDHFFLDGVRIVHAMDAATRYYTGLVYIDLSLASAVHDRRPYDLVRFDAPLLCWATDPSRNPSLSIISLRSALNLVLYHPDVTLRTS